MHCYIHIPFCDSKCGYCAFFSQVQKQSLIEPYFQALLHDVRHTINHYQVRSIGSIFVGGGTPNFVDSKYYFPIFELLLPLCVPDCEITFEMNPNLLHESWLKDIRTCNLNRISLGVQSFNAEKLRLLERNHTLDDIERAFEIASRYSDNLSLDLIYDCVLDTQELVYNELQTALKLPINHLSAYSLSIDSHSRFGNNARYDLQSKQSFGVLVRDILAQHGWCQYEVSNFTRNKQCAHNLAYWRGAQYLGMGASSVGRIGQIRYFAPTNLEGYIANPLARKEEHLSAHDLAFESVFMGLRSVVGVEKSLLKQEALQYVLSDSLCYEQHGRIYAYDFFLADSLALYLAK